MITQGLKKPDPKMSEKEFEEVLIEAFRKVNKNVLQVNVFPMRLTDMYVGRVYLKTSEDGKDFLSQYAYARSSLY